VPAPKNPAPPRLRLVSRPDTGELASDLHASARPVGEGPLSDGSFGEGSSADSSEREPLGVGETSVAEWGLAGWDQGEPVSSQHRVAELRRAAGLPALESQPESGSKTQETAKPDGETGELSDAQLVALARIGQKQAFEELYRRHAPYVLALAVRMQGNSADAEDVVHDAFLKVASRLAELRNDQSFRFWLARVVANLVRTRLRRRRFLGALGLADADPIELDLLVARDAGPEQRVQLAQVYECLQELAVDQRLAWVLRYVEGHKLEEVARLTSCSLATAKRRISIAQKCISAGTARKDIVRQDTLQQDSTLQKDGDA